MSEREIRHAKYDELTSFARVLLAAGVLETTENLQDYYEAPYKWNQEYRLWTHYEEPREDDPPWDAFVDLCFRGDGAIREHLFEALDEQARR